MCAWFTGKKSSPSASRSAPHRRLFTFWLREHPPAVIYLSFAVWFAIFLGWLLTHPASPGTSADGQIKRFLGTGYVQFLAALWGVAVTSLTYLLALPESAIDIQSRRLRHTQKERIRILEGFEPPSGSQFFHDDRSIYNAIINLVKRLKRAIPDLEKKDKHYSICMLLCSPALDYQ